MNAATETSALCNSVASAWCLLLERGADGSVALGPLLPANAERCWRCFQRRRQASARPLGTPSLSVLSQVEFERLANTRLRHHQIHPVDGVQRFIPPPGCPSGCVLRAEPQASLPLVQCVGNRLGPIKRVDLLQVLPGWWTAWAVGADTLCSAGMPGLGHGSASAPDAAQAERLALFEALERYAAGFWRTRPRASPPPQGHAGPGQGSATTPPVGPWVAVQVLNRKTRVWVPAAQVYLPFCDERGQWHANSEGLACGDGPADALQRALCELLERRFLRPELEAFLAATAPAPAALAGEIHTNPPGAAAAKGRPAAGSGAQTQRWRSANAGSCGPSSKGRITLRLGTLGQHTVCASLWRQPEPPYLVVGFGCHPEPAQAAHKAARERMHVAAHVRLALAQAPGGPSAESLLDRSVWRVALDAQAADALLARFLALHRSAMRTPRVTAGADLADGAAVGACDWAADPIGWIDLTPPDVRQFGLAVVRALWLPVPGLSNAA